MPSSTGFSRLAPVGCSRAVRSTRACRPRSKSREWTSHSLARPIDGRDSVRPLADVQARAAPSHGDIPLHTKTTRAFALAQATISRARWSHPRLPVWIALAPTNAADTQLRPFRAPLLRCTASNRHLVQMDEEVTAIGTRLFDIPLGPVGCHVDRSVVLQRQVHSATNLSSREQPHSIPI